MSKKEKKFGLRSKVWISDESGGVIFGLGRLKIFDAIERNGSIQAAAKELKMSYRGVWGRIKATEERLGQPMLIRKVGGSAGGGSRLTPFAKDLIEKFRQLHKQVIEESDQLFDEDLDKMLNKSRPSKDEEI